MSPVNIHNYFKLLITLNNIIYKPNITYFICKRVINHNLRVFLLKFLHCLHFLAKICIVIIMLCCALTVTLRDEHFVDATLVYNELIVHMTIIINTLFVSKRMNQFNNILTSLHRANQHLSTQFSEKYKETKFYNLLTLLTLRVVVILTADFVTHAAEYRKYPQDVVFILTAYTLTWFNELHMLPLELDIYRTIKYINHTLNEFISRNTNDNCFLEAVDIAYREVLEAQKCVDKMFGIFLAGKWFLVFNAILSYAFYLAMGTATFGGLLWSLDCFIPIVTGLLLVEGIKTQVSKMSIM